MLGQMIARYGRRLYGLCVTLCAGSPLEPDELYQETWLRALERLAQYDPTRPFEPWLTQICVNLYRSSLRRFLRSPVWNGFSTGEEKERALEAVIAEEPKDYTPLRQAVDKLPERLRMTVILFYYRDCNLEDTARILRIPPGTVKSRLSRARQLLRKELADETDLFL